MIRLCDDLPLVACADEGEHVLELRRAEAGVDGHGRGGWREGGSGLAFEDVFPIPNLVVAGSCH